MLFFFKCPFPVGFLPSLLPSFLSPFLPYMLPVNLWCIYKNHVFYFDPSWFKRLRTCRAAVSFSSCYSDVTLKIPLREKNITNWQTNTSEEKRQSREKSCCWVCRNPTEADRDPLRVRPWGWKKGKWRMLDCAAGWFWDSPHGQRDERKMFLEQHKEELIWKLISAKKKHWLNWKR